MLVNDCPKRCPITFNFHPELEINAANPAALEKRRGLLVRIVAAAVLRQGSANVVVHVTATADTPTSFFKLPGEVRNAIYELVLLCRDPIRPWYDRSREWWVTTGLFRTSKAVHSEASPLFYGQNRFDFTDVLLPERIVWFLEGIGCNNAGFIRHIIINFPKINLVNRGNLALINTSDAILSNIQSRCTNLSTLTTSIWGTSAMRLRELDNLQYDKLTTEALELVDTSFRAISSLQEIIVEVFDDEPSENIKGRMKSHGWTISTQEYSAEYFEEAVEEDEVEEDEVEGPTELELEMFLHEYDEGLTGYEEDEVEEDEVDGPTELELEMLIHEAEASYGDPYIDEDHDSDFWERAECAIYGK